jgi:hypothetical protein
VGLRFENISIPPGAVIISSSVQFTADEVQTEPTSLTIRSQATDNAPVFTTAAEDIGARAWTAPYVQWAPEAWNYVDERGPLQRTPDLSALIQAVVSRPGWTSGNALVLSINGTGHRTADAADKPGGIPAALTIRYTTEVPLATYSRWANGIGLASLGSSANDPDGDGQNNLLEYFFGTDPMQSNTNTQTLTPSGNSLVLVYHRASKAVDCICTPEWCDTLAGPWVSTGVTEQILTDDGTTQTRRAIVPAGGNQHRFVRLRVSTP